MRETKYLPKKYWLLINILAAASIGMAVLSALINKFAAYLVLAILLATFTVLRFVLFRCPHCGRLLNVLPSKEVADGVKSMFCVQCGGEISCK